MRQIHHQKDDKKDILKTITLNSFINILTKYTFQIKCKYTFFSMLCIIPHRPFIYFICPVIELTKHKIWTTEFFGYD